MAPVKRVVVAGGGISGLFCAYLLKKKGLDVTVLEREASAGGTMKTIRDGGWLVETGPNSALENTPLFSESFADLGITSQQVYANASASRRYIVKNGKLHPLPSGPGSFLTSGLWSTSAKLRLLAEPFAGRADKEESVAEFVRRRLGKEFLDYAVDPFVGGVYAGDPAKLSIQSAFPKLYALEKKYGGLVKGAIASRREGGMKSPRARLLSFSGGMQTFPDAIAARLGESLLTGATVEHIVPVRAGAFPVYSISVTQHGARTTIDADAIVLSSPAGSAAAMIRSIDPGMSATLEAIYYPPVAEVFLGFAATQIARPLDGFGFLVPSVEGRKILGSIWSSCLFEHRAPEGHVAFTTFVGGNRNPELVSMKDDELEHVVAGELGTFVGCKGDPVFRKIVRWPRAIPQYNLGYHTVMSAVERFEQNFRRAYICSNYRGGVSVGDCLMSAENIARRIEEDLRQ